MNFQNNAAEGSIDESNPGFVREHQNMNAYVYQRRTVVQRNDTIIQYGQYPPSSTNVNGPAPATSTIGSAPSLNQYAPQNHYNRSNMNTGMSQPRNFQQFNGNMNYQHFGQQIHNYTPSRPPMSYQNSYPRQRQQQPHNLYLQEDCYQQIQEIQRLNGALKEREQQLDAQQKMHSEEFENVRKQLEETIEKKYRTKNGKEELQAAKEVIGKKEMEIEKLERELVFQKEEMELKMIIEDEFQRMENSEIEQLRDSIKESTKENEILKVEIEKYRKEVDAEKIINENLRTTHMEEMELASEKMKDLEAALLTMEESENDEVNSYKKKDLEWSKEKEKLVQDLKDLVQKNQELEENIKTLRENERRKEVEGQKLIKEFTKFLGGPKSNIDSGSEIKVKRGRPKKERGSEEPIEKRIRSETDMESSIEARDEN